VHNVIVRSGLYMLLALALMGTASDAVPATTTTGRGLPAPILVAAADDQVTLNVLELFCRSCTEKILSGCRDIYGVSSVDVDRKDKLMTLHFVSSVTTRERVLAAVDSVVATIP
jgi:copper chaperone CopZ